MITTRTHRLFASGASFAIAAAGLAALAPAATAASGEQNFTCTVPILGATTFVVDADTNLPASVERGKKATFEFTARVSVPDSVRGAAVAFFGTEVKGGADVTSTIGGASAPVAATLPATAIPTTAGPLVLDVTGQGSWTPAALGEQKVLVSGFTANLVFVKAGTETPVSVPCTSSAPVVVDTVSVRAPVAPTRPVIASSKTTAKVSVAKKSRKATVSAKVRVGKKAASGKVSIKLKRGKKSIKTVTVKLNSKGAAKKSFAKLKKGSYSATVSYAGNAKTKKSKKVVRFRVK